MNNIDPKEGHKEFQETEEEKKAEVANILLYCPEDDTVFLMKRSAKVTYPGVWGAPGGHKEQGESLKDAAAREFIEEIGGLPRPIKNDLGYLSFTFNNKLIIMYILTVSIDTKENWTPPRLNPREVSDAKWFKISELPADRFSTITDTVSKIPSLVRLAIYYAFLYKKGRS